MKNAILSMLLCAAGSAWAVQPDVDLPVKAAQANIAAEAPEATEVQPLPVCQLDPQDSKRLLAEPCRPAPPVGARRAVPQVIGRMPATSMPATSMPPPVIHYQSVPPAPAAVSQPPSSPRPLGACDSGGCRDAAGARYNTGSGNQMLDANGRICHRNGAFIQCF